MLDMHFQTAVVIAAVAVGLGQAPRATQQLDVITDRAITVKAREKFMAMWNDHTRYRVWETH